MNNLKHLFFGALLFWLVVSASGLGSLGFARNPAALSVNELIQRIMASERRIHDVELRYDYILGDGFLLTKFDWGYEGGKEYYAGHKYVRANAKKAAKPIPFEKHVAFNGEKITRWAEGVGYGDNDEVFKSDLWGRIASFEWSPRVTELPFLVKNKEEAWTARSRSAQIVQGETGMTKSIRSPLLVVAKNA